MEATTLRKMTNPEPTNPPSSSRLLYLRSGKACERGFVEAVTEVQMRAPAQVLQEMIAIQLAHQEHSSGLVASAMICSRPHQRYPAGLTFSLRQVEAPRGEEAVKVVKATSREQQHFPSS